MAWAGTAISALGSMKGANNKSWLDTMSGNLFNMSAAKSKDKKAKNKAIAANLLYDPGGTFSSLKGIFGGGDGEGDDDMSLEDLLVYKQLPDYPEATQSRETWSKWLQDALAGGSYGATDMNWDEIFQSSKDKLNRYYWGGVNDSGLSGKVKASAARRGVSQSPALENQLSTLGFQNAIDLREMDTDLTTKKAQYTESARNTWLSSLQNLANLKPSFITSAGAVGPAVSAMYGDAQEGDTGTGNILGALGSLFANMGNDGGGEATTQNSSWMNNLLNSNVYGNSQSTIGSNFGSASPASNYGMNSNWSQNYLDNYNWN